MFGLIRDEIAVRERRDGGLLDLVTVIRGNVDAAGPSRLPDIYLPRDGQTLCTALLITIMMSSSSWSSPGPGPEDVPLLTLALDLL